jgi:hypothetical protein
MVPTRLLTPEQFEDRLAPAAFNVPWPDAPDLTLSFAPDGTGAAGKPSVLFRTLDTQLGAGAWEREVLRAFQTWAVAADVNAGVVADGGQPFGTLGLKQGDPRFGDIRIGAFPLAADTLAVADPYDPFIADTSTGDVYLNSNVPFGIGGASGSYDLFSVVLHEAGHVLGIGPSGDPNSPMFEQYQVHDGLTPTDMAALRALYGVRPPDPFGKPAGADDFATATALDLGGGPAGVASDITTLQDSDVFRLTVPNGSTALDVRLQAAGISLLVPRMTVYDASGRVIDSALATDPLHNDLTIHLGGVSASDVYFVKVQSGTDDVFGIGTYRLTIEPNLPAPWAAPSGPGAPRYLPPPSDGGANSAAPLAGAQLLATTPGYVEHTYYEAVGSVSGATPARAYRVLSPDLGSGLTNVMTVVVNSPDAGGVPLTASAYDAQGARVAATVIDDGNGHYGIQIPGVRSATDYYVEVQSDAPGGAAPGADYELDVDFALDGRHLQTFVNDTLGPGTPAVTRVLQVVESQQFQFVLSSTDWGAPAAAGARMTIFDAAGMQVFTLAAGAGADRFAEVFLLEGSYTVQFAREGEPGDTRTPVLFELSGLSQSDALGPQLRDTTLAPVGLSGGAALPAPSFFWLAGGPANLPAGGTASPDPSGAGQSVPSRAAGASGVGSLPSPAVGAAVSASDPNGRSAYLGSSETRGGQLPVPPSSGTARVLPFGAGPNAGAGSDDPTDVAGPGQSVPPPRPSVGRKGSGIRASAEPHNTDPAVFLVDSQTDSAIVPDESAPEGVPAPGHRPGGAGGSLKTGQLIWALGLGGAALSWLAARVVCGATPVPRATWIALRNVKAGRRAGGGRNDR